MASMYNKWSGHTVQLDDSVSDDDHSRTTMDIDRASVRSLDETQQSWLLGAGEQKKKKGIDLGCVIVSRRMCCILVCLLAFSGFVAGLTVLLIKTLPKHHKHHPAADNYTQALHKALLFFDAQKSGKLPKGYNISWRGDSALKDGLGNNNVGGPPKDLSGGFYDAGDNIKFTFPTAYAMTMLSWSVIEYRAKFVAAKEYEHVRDIIKWGTDYLLKTFNYTVNSTNIPYIYAQVGSGTLPTPTSPNDHYCWEKPENMDYARPAFAVNAGPELAGEMAAAMAAASIVFRDQSSYSKKLLEAAQSLLRFAEDKGKRSRYSVADRDAATFYNSSGYYDEYLWANAWTYFATGNLTYLQRATTAGLAANANAGGSGRYYGVFSWDNKLIGAQILLTRYRLMQSPPYPYDALLAQYHNETEIVMCSYLPQYKTFNRTKGLLTLFNYGQPAPLQYNANAAFLASLFADYLTTSDARVWPCGPTSAQTFYTADVLKKFARSQIDYILGKNPKGLSYVVGFGKNYPKQVHHRAASIPNDKQRHTCTGGFKFRDAKGPNPHVLTGAMVGGPDKYDGFNDTRSNYNYTEPTIAGNAGLVAALISLSEVTSGGSSLQGVDGTTMFANLPPMYIAPPPPPPPWKPA